MYDFVIIGSGIVGASTAYQLKKVHPNAKIAVFDKSGIALHQTGRNSGVIHSGIYYKPGSEKANNCIEGRKLLIDFCKENEIEVQKCGKLILATEESELSSLEKLYERGIENRIDCYKLNDTEISKIEPYAKGVSGVYIPQTSICDYRQVVKKLLEKSKADVINDEIMAVTNHLVVGKNHTRAEVIINCGGLQADRIAKMSGYDPPIKIIPFKGEYYKVKARYLCRGMIYPVPDPRFPFLGVHFTKTLNGLECGPSAVLAFGREAYDKWSLNLRDLIDAIGFKGFWKFAFKNFKTGVGEFWRFINKRIYLKSLQRLIPSIKISHLAYRPSGIRAQAMDKDGNLIDGFVIEKQRDIIHVLNSPSPAATACLSISKKIVSLLEK